MTKATIDIVVPVWNRPSETRNCLVSVMNHTPQARVVMVDNGSERETERILQELADSGEDAGERALLLRNEMNLGYVRALNQGFARSEAPYLALLRSGTLVPPGWFEPLLSYAEAHPEAGLLVPRLSSRRDPLPEAPIEVQMGSFCAMVITRAAYQAIGGLDEGLDDGEWCLRDYTRRASARGFCTCAVPGPEVACEKEVRLGSETRRQAALERSVRLFRSRWGEGRSYLVHVPDGVEAGHLEFKLQALLAGARHGDRFLVLVPKALYRGPKEGTVVLHEGISLVPLPAKWRKAARERLYRRLKDAEPGMALVCAVDGLPFPWADPAIPFTELCERIRRDGAEKG